MNQQSGIVLRERIIATLLGLAGSSTLVFSITETPWNIVEPVQFLLAVVFAAGGILAEKYPIHLGRGTKVSMMSLPIYLGVALLPAPLAIGVAGVSLLISNLWMRTEQGLLPRDIATAVGQWMVIAFLGHQINHLAIPSLDLSLTRFILLAAIALTFLVTDFTIFSLSNSFVLGEPFLQTLKTTLHEGIVIEGIQLLIAILGTMAIDESIWTLPLLVIPITTIHFTFKNLKEVRYETLNLLEDMADTVDLRDLYTGGHSKRVADLAHQILLELKVYGQETALIETAARLHDIGKIGISGDILMKPGKLTPEEMSIMQTHPGKGANLIAKYKDFSRGALMIRHHHERWDGQGYPARLKGYEIPFGSRVIAVADSFDAMISDRPYRKALSPKQALQILLDGQNKQWDANIVTAFIELMARQMTDDSYAPATIIKTGIPQALPQKAILSQTQN